MPDNGYVSMDINEHFDFIISCDIVLELTCVVYHSVHFVSIVYFFLFLLFSFRLGQRRSMNGGKGNAYRLLVGKPPLGRPRCRWVKSANGRDSVPSPINLWPCHALCIYFLIFYIFIEVDIFYNAHYNSAGNIATRLL
jgi:hypothetical protein